MLSNRSHSFETALNFPSALTSANRIDKFVHCIRILFVSWTYI